MQVSRQESSGSSDNTSWKLDKFRAELAAGPFRAEIDLRRPAAGLNCLQIGHESIPGYLLSSNFSSGGVSTLTASAATHEDRSPPAESLLDAYIRQGDLIAEYPSTPERVYRPSLYWRVLSPSEPPAVAAVELIASVQTHVLDSRPNACVSTALPAVELYRLTDLEKAEFKQVSLARTKPQHMFHTEGPGCFLWRLSGHRWSLAEMLLPSDFHSTEIVRDAQGNVRLSHPLFQRELEKGVILRARVRAVWLERSRDAQHALAWYREFLSSQPPLTA